MSVENLDKYVLQTKISNIFQKHGRDKHLTKEDVRKRLAEIGGYDTALVDECFQDLLAMDQLRFVHGKGYANTAYLGDIKAAEARRVRAGNNIVSRAVFDSMSPQAKMDFCAAGGLIE